MVQAFQEVVEVAEALVLLPGVDSVTPGPQVFTRAAARDLQVNLTSAMLHPCKQKELMSSRHSEAWGGRGDVL